MSIDTTEWDNNNNNNNDDDDDDNNDDDSDNYKTVFNMLKCKSHETHCHVQHVCHLVSRDSSVMKDDRV